MLIRALACPSCGAPIPPDETKRLMSCPFCGATVKIDAWAVAAEELVAVRDAEDRAPDDRPRVVVAGRPFAILGRLAEGESSDVFLAESVRRPKERVVVKVLRADADADLFENEQAVLAALARSTAKGADHFTTRLPERVAASRLREPGGAERPVAVYRYRSGFVHTFDEVREVYPEGVDGRHGVWMWRRLLETLAFVHASGFVHGGVLPQHLLVHAKEHGVLLVGYGSAGREGEPLAAVHAARAAFHPEPDGARRMRSRANDLRMGARAVAYVLGGAPDGAALPSHVPEPIAGIVRRAIAGEFRDALELHAAVGREADRAYGPPKFHVFTMPAL